MKNLLALLFALLREFCFDSIRDVMLEIRSRVRRHPGLAEIVNRDHRCILERIAARDPDGAAEAMRDHLEYAKAVQTEVLKGKK